MIAGQLHSMMTRTLPVSREGAKFGDRASFALSRVNETNFHGGVLPDLITPPAGTMQHACAPEFG